MAWGAGAGALGQPTARGAGAGAGPGFGGGAWQPVLVRGQHPARHFGFRALVGGSVEKAAAGVRRRELRKQRWERDSDSVTSTRLLKRERHVSVSYRRENFARSRKSFMEKRESRRVPHVPGRGSDYTWGPGPARGAQLWFALLWGPPPPPPAQAARSGGRPPRKPSPRSRPGPGSGPLGAGAVNLRLLCQTDPQGTAASASHLWRVEAGAETARKL